MIGIIKKMFYKKLFTKVISDLEYEVNYGNVLKIDGNDVENELTLSNKKCHQNAYDKFKQDKNYKIKVCYSCQKGLINGCIHFINYNIKTKKYFDNTWGSMNHDYIHYILPDKWIEKVLKENILKPCDWLYYTRLDFYNKYCTNKLWKIFLSEGDF